MPSSEELASYYRAATVARPDEERSAECTPPTSFSRAVGFLEYRLLGERTRSYRDAHCYLPPPGGPSPRLLDMGCGDGTTLAGFAGGGWEINGIDISPAAIDSARIRLPEATLRVSSLDELAPNLGRFDLVRLDNVLEHMLDPLKVLQTAKDYLRVGGELAIYVPNGRSLSLRLLRSRSVSHWVPFHLHLFTRASLTTLLERAGFGAIRVRYEDPASWWTLTMAQAVDRKVRLTEVGSRVAQSPGLRALALPFRCLSPLCGGEELVALARRERE